MVMNTSSTSDADASTNSINEIMEGASGREHEVTAPEDTETSLGTRRKRRKNPRRNEPEADLAVNTSSVAQQDNLERSTADDASLLQALAEVAVLPEPEAKVSDMDQTFEQDDAMDQLDMSVNLDMPHKIRKRRRTWGMAPVTVLTRVDEEGTSSHALLSPTRQCTRVARTSGFGLVENQTENIIGAAESDENMTSNKQILDTPMSTRSANLSGVEVIAPPENTSMVVAEDPINPAVAIVTRPKPTLDLSLDSSVGNSSAAAECDTSSISNTSNWFHTVILKPNFDTSMSEETEDSSAATALEEAPKQCHAATSEHLKSQTQTSLDALQAAVAALARQVTQQQQQQQQEQQHEQQQVQQEQQQQFVTPNLEDNILSAVASPLRTPKRNSLLNLSLGEEIPSDELSGRVDESSDETIQYPGARLLEKSASPFAAACPDTAELEQSEHEKSEAVGSTPHAMSTSVTIIADAQEVDMADEVKCLLEGLDEVASAGARTPAKPSRRSNASTRKSLANTPSADVAGPFSFDLDNAVVVVSPSRGRRVSRRVTSSRAFSMGADKIHQDETLQESAQEVAEGGAQPAPGKVVEEVPQTSDSSVDAESPSIEGVEDKQQPAAEPVSEAPVVTKIEKTTAAIPIQRSHTVAKRTFIDAFAQASKQHVNTITPLSSKPPLTQGAAARATKPIGVASTSAGSRFTKPTPSTNTGVAKLASTSSSAPLKSHINAPRPSTAIGVSKSNVSSVKPSTQTKPTDTKALRPLSANVSRGVTAPAKGVSTSAKPTTTATTKLPTKTAAQVSKPSAPIANGTNTAAAGTTAVRPLPRVAHLIKKADVPVHTRKSADKPQVMRF